MCPVTADLDELDEYCSSLDYVTTSTCDQCDAEREGTMLHHWNLTAHRGFRIDAVLFLCRECAPNQYAQASGAGQDA